MEGPGADSEEKHEPASDIDTVVVDSLKALDPKRPIREATATRLRPVCREGPNPEVEDAITQTTRLTEKSIRMPLYDGR
jgi:hypothetical protein